MSGARPRASGLCCLWARCEIEHLWPIVPARKSMNVCARVLLHAAVLAPISPASSNVKTIDLTAVRSAPSIGEPGATHSGCVGCKEEPYQLPLKIEMADIRNVGDDQSEVEMIVTNSGSTNFQLPTELPNELFRKNGSRRKAFSFLLRVEDPSTDKVTLSVIAVTYSSDLRPSSYLLISPGERVLIKALWNRNSVSIDPRSKQILVTAGCSEYVLQNNDFIIKERSSQVFDLHKMSIHLGGSQP